jgi:hypothetical protein
MGREHGVQQLDDRGIGTTLKRAFAQPIGQQLPQDFLALLAALDRSKSEPAPRSST